MRIPYYLFRKRMISKHKQRSKIEMTRWILKHLQMQLKTQETYITKGGSIVENVSNKFFVMMNLKPTKKQFIIKEKSTEHTALIVDIRLKININYEDISKLNIYHTDHAENS